MQPAPGRQLNTGGQETGSCPRHSGGQAIGGNMYIPHKSNAQVMRPTAAEIDRRRGIIKELRRAHGIATQTELADRLGVSQPLLSTRLTGRVDMTMTELQALIYALDLTDGEMIALLRPDEGGAYYVRK